MRIASICRILTLVPSLALFTNVVVAQTPIGIFEAQTDVGRARGSRPALYEPQLFCDLPCETLLGGLRYL